MTDNEEANPYHLVEIGLAAKRKSVQSAQSDDAEVAGRKLEDTTDSEPQLADALASCNGDDCALARYLEIAHTVDACAVNGCQSLLT
jgi:hypothetical protein